MAKYKASFFAAAIFALAGCASTSGGPILGTKSAQNLTVPMATSDKIPAAQGQVSVGDTKNNNTSVNVSVKHLAPPEKIESGANSYVVWEKAVGQDTPPQNIGALTVDKNLTGNLQTVTPFKDFEIFVTAENSITAQQPSGDKLMWTNINR